MSNFGGGVSNFGEGGGGGGQEGEGELPLLLSMTFTTPHRGSTLLKEYNMLWVQSGHSCMLESE